MYKIYYYPDFSNIFALRFIAYQSLPYYIFETLSAKYFSKILMFSTPTQPGDTYHWVCTIE